MRTSIVRQRRVLNPREQGFSLVELIVAMLIIAVVLMLLIGIQIRAAVTVTEARERQQATAFANEAVEQMRALPWNTLSKGLYTGFEGASGGDELVSGGQLTVDGQTVNLRAGATDLSEPVFPLFDEDGSHTQTRRDPSLAGVDFTVKSYVYTPDGASVGDNPTLGLVAVVEWPDRDGEMSRTTIWSTAYRGGGCGDLSTQPFLGACQAHLQSDATSGTVVTSVLATTVATVDDEAEVVPIIQPDADDLYSLSMRTASAVATADSQQATLVKAILEYGGTTIDDNDDTTEGDDEGYSRYEVLATSDESTAGDIQKNPPDLTVEQTATSETTRNLQRFGSPIGFRAQSDYAREGIASASSTQSCHTGVPAGEPCAESTITNLANDGDGSGYIVMDAGDSGKVVRTSRRLAELGGNSDTAWAARFTASPGTSSVGCETVSEAGCISAGAQRTLANLHLGTAIGTASSWDGDAGNGLVLIRGNSACGSSYYRESVLAQRGASQLNTVPELSRCGQVLYWTGASYATVDIDVNTATTRNTEPVTLTDDDVTVTAVAQVQVSPGFYETTGEDAACREEACGVRASSGNIVVNVTYRLTWPGYDYLVTSSTTINGASATASFKEAPEPGDGS